MRPSFAANPDPAESDLAKLDRTALAERLPGWNFVLLDQLARIEPRAPLPWASRGELHRPLLYAVLLLLLLESFLAWKFGHHDSSS